MKRFAKALSLLVAAAMLMATVSTSVSAAAVSSVTQSDSSVTFVNAEGVEEGKEIIVSIPEDVLSDLDHTGVAEDHDDEMQEAMSAAAAVDTATQAFDGGLASEAADLGVNEGDLQFTSIFNVYVQDHVEGQAVTITLKTQLSAGTPYVLAHYYDEQWHVNSHGVVGENGTVTFTADRFSPFAIITVSNTTTNVESPQTGESANALLIASIALAAAAVVVVSGRKVTR